MGDSTRSGLLAVLTLFLVPTFGGATGPGEASVSMVEPGGEAAKWWPRWRGPSAQGHVAGGGYVDTWSADTNVRWRVPVPGSGNSSRCRDG